MHYHKLQYRSILTKYLVIRKPMSGIGSKITLKVKNQAIGLLLAGKTQGQVAIRFKMIALSGNMRIIILTGFLDECSFNLDRPPKMKNLVIYA